MWLASEFNFAGALVPPQINGLVAAIIGMLAGSLGPQLISERRSHGAHTAADPH